MYIKSFEDNEGLSQNTGSFNNQSAEGIKDHRASLVQSFGSSLEVKISETQQDAPSSCPEYKFCDKPGNLREDEVNFLKNIYRRMKSKK